MTRQRKWQSAAPEAIDLDTDPVLRQFWKDLDEDQQAFLLSMDAEVTVCHGTLRHKFAGITPGKPVSDSVVISRREGVYQVIEYCEEGCGRFIYYSAGHNGRPDRSTKRYGGWAPGKEIAAGLGISAWQFRFWMEHCQASDVVAAFKLQEKQRRKTEAAAARQAGKPLTEDVPAAVFSDQQAG